MPYRHFLKIPPGSSPGALKAFRNLARLWSGGGREGWTDGAKLRAQGAGQGQGAAGHGRALLPARLASAGAGEGATSAPPHSIAWTGTNTGASFLSIHKPFVLVPCEVLAHFIFLMVDKLLSLIPALVLVTAG